jgi:ParB family chromosome partitioning protein
MPSARKVRPTISFDEIEQSHQLVRPVQDCIVYEIDVDRIVPSPRNPREDLGDVDELADNINACDLLQPVLVRRLRDDRYELIAGHRRFAAVKQLGRPKIAAVVRDADEDQANLMTLAENLAREDLTPAEEAAGLAVLVREHNWSVRKVAAAIHKSHAYVGLRLRVFEAEDLRAPVLRDQLSVSAAEELLRVPPEQRAGIIQQAVRERRTPAQARRARKAARATWLDSNHHRPAPQRAVRIRALADELADVEAASLSAREQREVRHLAQILNRLRQS